MHRTDQCSPVVSSGGVGIFIPFSSTVPGGSGSFKGGGDGSISEMLQ